jgi:peroxiredoxin
VQKGGEVMLRLISITIAAVAALSAQAAEPFRLVITDVEKNVHRETAQINSGDVTPDCPVSWSVRKSVLHGGEQEGVEAIDVDNGKLRFTVIPTRGMSIYQVVMGDLRLGGDSSVKNLAHPKSIDPDTPQGQGRLEGFNGWIVRCGLESFGTPGTDELIGNTGKKSTMDLTPYGKIGSTPASVVEVTVERQPPYRIAVRGRLAQGALSGPKLELWTEISTTPGAASFRISDKLTNRTGVAQEFSILYHSSYGPPLMKEGAKFFGPARQVTPMNEHAAEDVSDYYAYRAPQAESAEQVYGLRLWADKDDRTMVLLRNAAGDKAVSIAFSVKELPFFTFWRGPTANGDGYVTGLEPGTDLPRSRAIEHRFGRVPKLGPHQSRSFTIDFALHVGKDEVHAAGDQIARIWAGRRTQIDTQPIAASPPAETKPKLGDIVKAARTWRAGYQNWYGRPAPDFTLTDIAGKQHKLSTYRGKNVIIILWATWCGPCRMEIPQLIELRNTVSDDDLAVLAVSNEGLNLVKRFVARAGINYTVLLDRGGLPEPYNTVNAIPSSFFIDRQGKIKLSTTGLVSLNEIKAILEAE